MIANGRCLTLCFALLQVSDRQREGSSWCVAHCMVQTAVRALSTSSEYHSHAGTAENFVVDACILIQTENQLSRKSDEEASPDQRVRMNNECFDFVSDSLYDNNTRMHTGKQADAHARTHAHTHTHTRTHTHTHTHTHR